MPPHLRLLAAACAAPVASADAAPAAPQAIPEAAPQAVGAFGRWTVAVGRDGPDPVC